MGRTIYSQEWARFVKARRGYERQLPFAARAGLSASYLSRIETGLVPPRERVESIAVALGDSTEDWLRAAGYSESPYGGVADHGFQVSEAPPPPVREVQGTVSDGGEIVWEASGRPEQSEAAIFILRVTTDSLAPRFLRGERLGFRVQGRPRRGQVIVVKDEGKYSLAKFAAHTTAGLRITHANAPDVTSPVELAGAEVVGVFDFLRPA